MSNYGKVTGWLIGAWFVFAVSASAMQLFNNEAERIGLAVAIAAGAPIVCLRCGSRFREHFGNLHYRWIQEC
jgi:hypothetical protein